MILGYRNFRAVLIIVLIIYSLKQINDTVGKDVNFFVSIYNESDLVNTIILKPSFPGSKLQLPVILEKKYNKFDTLVLINNSFNRNQKKRLSEYLNKEVILINKFPNKVNIDTIKSISNFQKRVYSIIVCKLENKLFLKDEVRGL